MPSLTEIPGALTAWSARPESRNLVSPPCGVQAMSWSDGGCGAFAGAVELLFPSARSWIMQFSSDPKAQASSEPDNPAGVHVFVELGGQCFDGDGVLAKNADAAALAFLSRQGLDRQGHRVLSLGVVSLEKDCNIDWAEAARVAVSMNASLLDKAPTVSSRLKAWVSRARTPGADESAPFPSSVISMLSDSPPVPQDAPSALPPDVD